MTVCHLALGSNINPHDNLRWAIDHLTALPQFELEAASPCYETAPWGITEQPAFWNLVLRGDWQGDARSLLQATQQIEAELNRVRVVKNGPRTIDIDILLFGQQAYDEAALKIPHPGLLKRDFMLVPLLEISPEAIDPRSDQPLKHFQEALPIRCIRHQVKGGGLG